MKSLLLVAAITMASTDGQPDFWVQITVWTEGAYWNFHVQDLIFPTKEACLQTIFPSHGVTSCVPGPDEH